MILKDLVYALRNLSRNKLLAAINVLGLSIGISACLIIYLIVSFELSFDTFQPDRKQIFRVYSKFSGAFEGVNRGMPTAIPVAIRETFTGLDAVTNFHTFSAKVDISGSGHAARDLGQNDNIILAGPDFFEVFRYYEWVHGDPQQSLAKPFQVVLTESRARIYFGDVALSSVIGREIRYQDSLTVNVSGILKDVGERTDFDFSDFISSATIEKSWLRENILLDDWENTNSSSQVFIRLADETTLANIQAQIPHLVKTMKANSGSPDWTATPMLQPLSDIHFDTATGIFDNSRSVAERSTLQVLAAVAALLLLMAAVNFINLETAQASMRAKEVGVRKVLGSSRTELVKRFLCESFLLSACAALVSIGLSEILMVSLAEFIPGGLVLDVLDPGILFFLVGFIILITLLAGLYPAFVLSGFQPALALRNTKGADTGMSRTAFIRKGLTIFQFSFSQILILATVAIGLQLNYMLNKDLGFSTDAIIYVGTPWWESNEKRLLLRNELSEIPEIEAVTMQGDPPTSAAYSSAIMDFDNGKEVMKHNVFIKRADTAYLRVYDIQLLAGRNLLARDSVHEYLINETYMRALGFSSPWEALGKTIHKDYDIAGVVKDFHNKSLHSPIEPAVIKYERDPPSFGIKLFTPRKKVANLSPAIEKIRSAWQKIYPEQEFQYHFLSDSLKRHYENEQRVGKLCRIATVIAIVISCLGLFGLSSFTVIQRTKEIGIRKVLGASVNSIMLLLSKDFLLLVSVAFVLSTPVAYFVADRWLQDFAYRMDLSVWLFLMSGMFSLIIAFITISFRTASAAKADPVKSLKYE